VRPGIRPGFRSMSLTDAPTRRWPESQFRSLSVAQLPVRPRPPTPTLTLTLTLNPHPNPHPNPYNPRPLLPSLSCCPCHHLSMHVKGALISSSQCLFRKDTCQCQTADHTHHVIAPGTKGLIQTCLLTKPFLPLLQFTGADMRLDAEALGRPPTPLAHRGALLRSSSETRLGGGMTGCALG